MNGLEAFKKLREYINIEHRKIVNVDVETIGDYPLDKIEKELKVLQILKENSVDLALIDYWRTRTTTIEELLYRYNDRACDWVGDLTLEEMTLIVEWKREE